MKKEAGINRVFFYVATDFMPDAITKTLSNGGIEYHHALTWGNYGYNHDYESYFTQYKSPAEMPRLTRDVMKDHQRIGICCYCEESKQQANECHASWLTMYFKSHPQQIDVRHQKGTSTSTSTSTTTTATPASAATKTATANTVPSTKVETRSSTTSATLDDSEFPSLSASGTGKKKRQSVKSQQAAASVAVGASPAPALKKHDHHATPAADVKPVKAPKYNGDQCLTMHQPWASLLVYGIKRVEGRTWNSDLRGRLWIHAASIHPSQQTIDTVQQQYKQIYGNGKCERR
jgi:hypothetical protein